MAEVKTASRLDAFAEAPVARQAMVPAGGGGMISSSPVGAQAVAVYRDEQRVMDKLKVLAAAAGEEWFYRFPVRNKDGTTGHIEGPSIKLAMSLARIYGNCDVDCRVMDMGDEWIFYARFTDFETGFTTTRPFQQRKNQKTMGKDEDRQRDIALQIGASKAIRNVVVNALRDFADYSFEEAKKSLVEKIGKNLPQWRTKVADRLAEEKIDIARAERLLGRALGEWTAPDVAKIVALGKAVSDGMTTWTDALPELETAASAKGEGTVKAEPEKAATEKAAATTETVDQETGEVSEGEPSPAFTRGSADRRRGVGPRAVPKELKGAAAADWTKGWQAEDRLIHEGEQGSDADMPA
jgi:hypothetical protein